MKRHHSFLFFCLFPALSMLLGWGLRGYIGGGPLTAMIPGAQVALCIALMLRLPAPFAAILTLFGAVGVGYGGEMTYGQTIGLAVDPDTQFWGLLGLALKGGAWGLLSGAMIGLGLCHERYGKRTTLIALGIMAATFYIGTKLINDPMLIYFSNPDKPRFECWFGLYAAALALLLFLWIKKPASLAFSPFNFALCGFIGGVIGFGGGGLWMVLGPHIPTPAGRIGWWKCMEFTFGFFFGAGLGAAAWWTAPKLPDPEEKGWLYSEQPQRPWLEWGITLAAGVLVFLILPLTLEPFFENLWREGSNGFLRFGTHVAVSFITFATILLLIGLRSRGLAWQLAIAFTLCHSIIDLTTSLLEHKDAGIPAFLVVLLACAMVMTVLLATWRLRLQHNALLTLFLFLSWFAVLISYGKSLIHPDLLFPTESALEAAGSCWAYEWKALGGRVFVQGVFTVSLLIATAMACCCRDTHAEE